MNKAGVAAILSFLIPGLGQVYNGDFVRAFFWFIFAVFIGVSVSPLAMGVPSLVFHLVCAYCAYQRGQRHGVGAVP
jgi:TM2 domain-containing membrane protein YozV